MARFSFAQRGDYDTQLLDRMFRELPRDAAATTAPGRMAEHRDYVAMLRRRQYFERRDENWKEMLPYRTADQFWRLVTGATQPGIYLNELITAINRGEGLSDPKRLGNALALRVRLVDRGTVRSYRLFPGENFKLLLPAGAGNGFVEHIPQALRLVYSATEETHGDSSTASARRQSLRPVARDVRARVLGSYNSFPLYHVGNNTCPRTISSVIIAKPKTRKYRL